MTDFCFVLGSSFFRLLFDRPPCLETMLFFIIPIFFWRIDLAVPQGRNKNTEIVCAKYLKNSK